MSTPILATKLYVPPPQPRIVPRPRLTKRLDEGLRRRLTLVSAPAGFVKSTLLGEWIAGCGQQVAWLSLDESDYDPTRFLSYLVAALQTIAPDIGESFGRSQLFLSLKTVRNYVSNILTKLQVSDRAQAIIRAREAGLGTKGDLL